MVSRANQLKFNVADGKKYITDTFDYDGIIELAKTSPELKSVQRDQLIKASDVPRQFTAIRKQAKGTSCIVTENGEFDTVILNYQYFEELYSRLLELETASRFSPHF